MDSNSEEVCYTACNLCPRLCGIDRMAGKTGYCRERSSPRIASAVLHGGEEPPLVTGAGSGTIFFSGCTLRCASCQNCQISAESMGAEVSSDDLADIMLSLAELGASNINLVTGTHVVIDIVDAVVKARHRGLDIPVVWNTAGYERIETLELLSSVVDVWLPDLKTLDRSVARNLLNAADYPIVAQEAIGWMLKRAPIRFDGDALVSGTMVRHLMLPGYFDDSRTVMSWLSGVLPGRGLFSLMSQYLPMSASGPARQLDPAEHEAGVSLLARFGFSDGYVQELASDDEWVPDFSRLNPFPGPHARPVWHWSVGFVE